VLGGATDNTIGAGVTGAVIGTFAATDNDFTFIVIGR
jgi:hypothetical protein